MMGDDLVSTWVWPESLRPFIETVSRWIDYGFDDHDWTAIRSGLDETNADLDQWYKYPLVGQPELVVEVATTPGDAPVSIRFRATGSVEPALRTRLEAAAEVFNSYKLGE